MKKILGIFVAVSLCICMLVPAVSAADTSSITALIEDLGVDLGDKGLSNSELSSILGSLNLEGFDAKSIKSALDSGDSSKLSDIESALKSLEATPLPAGSTSTDGNAAGGSGSPLDSISSLLGGFDISSIASGDMLSSITDMFGSVDMSSFDVSSLMDTISGAFGENGIDLSSITSGMDMGSFDISSILGGIGGGSDSGDTASGATDKISSIMDSLTSGLGSLGLDTSKIEGLLDNEVVNTIANLFIGLGDTLGISGGSSADATTAATTTSVATTTPAVVTTKTPKTGDTSTALIAFGTFTMAAAAAFVCLKKKEN